MLKKNNPIANNHLKVPFFCKEIILAFLISKIFTVALILGFFNYFDSLHYENLWNRWYSGISITDAFYLPFANWDAQHYLLLSDWGYNALESSRAFFPLYPFTIKIFSLIFINPYLSAFISNLVFSYLFFYFFYKYAIQYIDKSKVLRSYILILCYPAAFFLTVLYSEALFLFLLFAFLYYYEKKNSYWSVVFAFLLPLARGQALFILGAILLLIIIRWGKNEKIDTKYEISNLLAFLVGGAAYYACFHLLTGNAFSGIEAQESYVSNHKLVNTLNLVRFVNYLFSFSPNLFDYNNAIMDKLFIFTALFCNILVLKSKKISWIIFYFMLSYPVASMGEGMSYTRYFLLSIPFFSLALFKTKEINKYIFYSACIGMLSLQVYFIFRFSLNMWVG